MVALRAPSPALRPKPLRVVRPADCDDAPALEYLVARARLVPRQHFDRTDTTWEAWLNWWDSRELFLDNQAHHHAAKVMGGLVQYVEPGPWRPAPMRSTWVFEQRVADWHLAVAAVEARA